MARLFIGFCFAGSSMPRNKSKTNSSSGLPINKNSHNNRAGVPLSEPGEKHEYIMNTLIEPLFREGLRNSERNDWRQLIERVLKVENTPEKVSRFEEQVQAQEDSQTGPCSLANLDVLWRFYGAPVSCSLASKGLIPTLQLCDSDECGLCSVLRHEKRGICTTTSSMALEYIGDVTVRKAVILCKVVPGRIDLTSSEKEHDPLSCFNPSHNRKATVLYVRNSSALLPKYVVLFKRKQCGNLQN
ncbi:uncharacterized protein LOC112202946 [Rosa chinensis]|uniref:uncharacterized protein LOC112202946 n=1 Tax=Rosa chinensis TaxID=74649 RepID=UPI000D08E1EB|nr:uncharacterized protein LOC112202946 [Rosa chinensis]